MALARISARRALGLLRGAGATRALSSTTAARASGAYDEGCDLFNPSESHRAVRDMVRAFTEEEVDPQALEHNRNEEFNLPLFRKLGELGLLGITVPEEYGGSGMDAVAACVAHEELSAADPAFCLSFLAHSMLFVNNLARNGTHEQKEAWLPRTSSGELVGGMCMSEPGYGTDVLGLATRATRVDDGSGDWVLNGQKMWITNGSIADGELGDVFLVYARTGGKDVPDSKAISLFLVPKGTDGFSLGQKIEDKCGMRASTTAALNFDGARVPAANLVGEEGGAVRCMMRNLEIERVTLAAMSLGIARRCVEVMNGYAAERQAFGVPINHFGQIQRHVAESYAEYMAARAYVYHTAGRLDLDAETGARLDTDGVKLFATKMGTTVANRAMQVLGGNGYVGEYQVERLWRDAKLLEIGGGTLESHHKNMTRELRAFEKLE